MSPLTPDDLIQINGMINDAIAMHLNNSPTNKLKKDYHTIHDIRRIILEHVEEMRSFLGDSDFPIGIIKAYLKRKTILTPNDKTILRSNKNACEIRFERQVVNAIQSHNWFENPFEPTKHRGYYRLRPVASQLEI